MMFPLKREVDFQSTNVGVSLRGSWDKSLEIIVQNEKEILVQIYIDEM